MISIIVVNYNAYDFLGLLLESLEIYSSLPHETIVVDNSLDPRHINRPHVHQFIMERNTGHGYGLNYGILQNARMFPDHEYTMFLDVDCHFLRNSWELPFLKKMETYDLIGGRGVPAKPIRPACMFFKKKLQHYNWQDTAGYQGHRITPEGYDVAILAYHQICADGFRVGLLEGQRNRYGTLNGEEWCIDGIPLVYHHWHGSHLKERSVDFPGKDLFADRDKLFSQIPWRMPF